MDRRMSVVVLILATVLLLTLDAFFRLGLVTTLSEFLVVFLFLSIALAVVGVKSD